MYNPIYRVLGQMEYDCPFCSKPHQVEIRSRVAQATIKGETVSYEKLYYYCPDCPDDENEFVPAGLNDENLLRARNAYRCLKGLLTSSEIIDIRKLYGLTQNELSSLLGWGDVTIARYETKLIQDETYDKLIRMIVDNPQFALDSLVQHQDRFSEARYEELKNCFQEKISNIGSSYYTKQGILSHYSKYLEPCDYNGYQSLNIEKIGSMIAFFADKVKYLYKVRLMKLLWFSDALSFSRRKQAMSGLVYQHMAYGALPIASQDIIYLPTVSVEEEEEIQKDQTKYRILPVSTDFSNLSEEEISILLEVFTKFQYVSTEEIVHQMHEEDAYKQTQMRDIIPFSLCQHLRAFGENT